MQKSIDKIRETFLAPVGSAFLNRGTRVIEDENWYQLITPGVKEPSRNEVVFSRIEPSQAEDKLDEVIKQYRDQGLPMKWCVGPLTEPADFGKLLENRGFSQWDVRGMACDPAVLKLEWDQSKIFVERLGKHNLEDFVRASTLGWAEGKSEKDVDFGPLREDCLWAFEQPNQRHQFFLARYEGKPAGTAGFILKQNSAYLVGGNVLPEYRGKGIYRALIGKRLRLVREKKLTLAVTQAREATSAPILEKLGFESIYKSKIYQLL